MLPTCIYLQYCNIVKVIDGTKHSQTMLTFLDQQYTENHIAYNCNLTLLFVFIISFSFLITYYAFKIHFSAHNTERFCLY